jgi:hypothetical protein
VIAITKSVDPRQGFDDRLLLGDMVFALNDVLGLREVPLQLPIARKAQVGEKAESSHPAGKSKAPRCVSRD